MKVPMMGIGHVGMVVHQMRMLVPVRMRFARRISRCVGVLVVLVVVMGMFVCEGGMDMLVLVPLGDVQPDASRHQRRGDQELECHRFTQQKNRGNGAEERCS